MLKFKEDKTSIAYKLRELIYQNLLLLFKESDIKIRLDEIVLEHPENPNYGDFSCNIAFKLAKQLKKEPLAVAKVIAQFIARQKENRELKFANTIGRVEVAGPGFINFWLSEEWLMEQAGEILEKKEGFGKLAILKGNRILLEHTSPDPIKTLHVGHLRNNFLGMAMSRIFKALGAAVTLDCINNDRGTHVCQAMVGFLGFAEKFKVQSSKFKAEDLKNFRIPEGVMREIGENFKWREALRKWVERPGDWLKPEDLGLKPDHFDLRVYAAGAGAIGLVPALKEQAAEILQAWEAEEAQVWQLWRQMIDWSLQGYEKTYQRIGSHHDYVWHESELYKGGKELVKSGLKKGIFKKSKGAVVTDLAKYNLPDTVMIKSDGTALYITFDINLTKQKKVKFPADLYIWDIGNDQKLYLQQMFSVCEQLGIAKKEELFHLNYGYVYLKGKGKMSSREGTIISADDLLELLVRRAGEIREAATRSKAQEGGSDEKIGLGALKYALLKSNRGNDIFFDMKESVSLEGNSGPYLQYTYARTQSVLAKALWSKTIQDRRHISIRDRINKEERVLLRTLYQFPEVVARAGEEYAPNLVCNYLYDLATKYNTFYNKYRIIDSDNEEVRLEMTAAVGQVLKNGLSLLGIEALEEM